jgi:hypothetical protein
MTKLMGLKIRVKSAQNLQILFYFNNNLGIEELGMSIIIIIILCCGYDSLTKLIRLIGGQLIIKQLLIN